MTANNRMTALEEYRQSRANAKIRKEKKQNEKKMAIQQAAAIVESTRAALTKATAEWQPPCT